MNVATDHGRRRHEGVRSPTCGSGLAGVVGDCTAGQRRDAHPDGDHYRQSRLEVDRIKSFRFKRLSFTCFGGSPPGRVTGTVGTMKVEKGPNPFDPAKRTNVYFAEDGQLTVDGKIGVFILGIINRKGTRTSGNLGISFGDGCHADRGTGFSKFKATG
jgi:hypothetical protein